ncbi:hypothetical protein AS156_04975 [Bradyrhizobium macuxiense]|uniref:Uncharacterized protein n=1 Tax=Bradyrhizobium macuxiense TaxID=1755647 RepID=A0A109JW09_9BRAD|nr:hypothetical protein AS156_04975 [Bradyrhizobium macuxiense]
MRIAFDVNLPVDALRKTLALVLASETTLARPAPPPGATHVMSASASNTEPAEMIAVFVADEGAQLTTLLDR